MTAASRIRTGARGSSSHAWSRSRCRRTTLKTAWCLLLAWGAASGAGATTPAGARRLHGVSPIVDSHVHLFPYLGDASGFTSEAEHRQFLQLYMATHGEPVRRLADHSSVHEQTLHDGRLADPSSLRSVNFRVGRFGRFEWTVQGSDLYLQYFPPSLQTMASPPEFMAQQMARAGVDRAVLQNARPYGRLNDYFAGAVRPI